jgi:polyisoprenoid-binding protein YceI
VWKNIFIILCCTQVLFAKEAEKIQIDISKSKIVWTGKKSFINSKHSGVIKIKSGWVVFDNNRNISDAKIVIDMTSIENTDLKDPKKAKKLERHLKSEDFFAVNEYPESVLYNVEQIGGDNFRAQLKIKKTTKKINFKMSLTEDKKKAKGSLTFNRTEWNIIYGSKSFFKKLIMDRIIDDMIELKFDIVVEL